MKLPPFYDAVAALFGLILLGAVIMYPLMGHEVPQLVESAFTLALGWVFRGGVGAANDWWHTRNGGQNGQPSPVGPAPPDSP